MRGRLLTVIVVASFGLNAFLAAAVVTLLVLGAANPATHALRSAAQSLSPPHRQAFLQVLRAAGRQTRPQNQAARALRREVWTDLQAPTFDAAAEKAKLARARTLNIEARQVVEDGMIDFAAALPAQERAALGQALLRMTPLPRPLGRRR